jgi:acylphosphatase
MEPIPIARLHTTITGYVQGVGFRAFVLRSGRSFGLSGWVRNRPNGAVEVVAEGRRNLLELLLADLYRGPAGADVDDVTVEWLPPTGEYRSFDMRSTA